MAITTYGELKTAAAAWAHRTDLGSVLDDCVTLCEARLNDMLLLKNMESDEPLAMVIGQNYVALPTGFISPIACWLVVNGFRLPLDFRLPQELPYYTTNSQPKYVAVDGANLRFDVPAQNAYTLYLRCIKASNLSDASPTNYLLSKRPDVYLAGTLVEIARYTQDQDLFNMWESKFQAACADLKAAENRNRGVVEMINDAIRPRRRSNIYVGP